MNRKHQNAYALIKDGKIQLGALWRSRRAAWLLALLVGLVTLLFSTGLLAISGWFITAAATVGIANLANAAFVFNYDTPSAIIRLFALGRTVSRYGERLLSHNAALGMLADLRTLLFAELLKRAMRNKNSQSSQQMHRLTSDVDTLNEWPLAVLLPWGWAVLMIIAYIIFMAVVDAELLLWVLPPLLIGTFAVPWQAAHYLKRYSWTQAAQNEERRTALLSPLTALTSLLQWGRWHDFAGRFNEKDHRYSHTLLHIQHRTSLFALAQQWCLVAAYGFLLWRGCLAVMAHTMSPAVLLALFLGLLGASEAFTPLVMKAASYGNSLAARDRLNALIAGDVDQESSRKLIDIPLKKWCLKAENLSARQPLALTGPTQVNFTLKAGDVLVISGASGCGKSTLLDVLSGELPLQEGRLTLNDQDLDSFYLTPYLGYLAQRWMIFDLTLADNLRLGCPDASDDDLWDALAKVGLEDWAIQQPEQLDTPLGEYGTAVSGGQARRIALARLLLRDQPLMLLDEPFAGLEPELRQTVFETLKAHQKNGILVLVSHHELDWGEGVQHLHFNGHGEVQA